MNTKDLPGFVMSEDNAFSEKNLVKLMQERSKSVLQRFEQIVNMGVTSPELLSILKRLVNYWKERLRPALVCFSCEAVGGTPDMAEDAGLMFTLAAAGTQIHDEIIDKSSRNFLRETIYGTQGTDRALLTGDFLIFKAWTMLKDMIFKTKTPLQIAKIIEMYGSISIEICEAELLETSFRRELNTKLEDYENNFLWRINADLGACTMAGAILGGGTELEIQALADVGRRLGFIMGLHDDIMDSLNLKVNLEHRLEYESIPLPILYAAKSSQENHLKIAAIIETFPLTPLDIEELWRICSKTGAYTYMKDLARRNSEIATQTVNKLKPSAARNNLELLIKKFYNDVVKLLSTRLFLTKTRL